MKKLMALITVTLTAAACTVGTDPGDDFTEEESVGEAASEAIGATIIRSTSTQGKLFPRAFCNNQVGELIGEIGLDGCSRVYEVQSCVYVAETKSCNCLAEVVAEEC